MRERRWLALVYLDLGSLLLYQRVRQAVHLITLAQIPCPHNSSYLLALRYWMMWFGRIKSRFITGIASAHLVHMSWRSTVIVWQTRNTQWYGEMRWGMRKCMCTKRVHKYPEVGCRSWTDWTRAISIFHVCHLSDYQQLDNQIEDNCPCHILGCRVMDLIIVHSTKQGALSPSLSVLCYCYGTWRGHPTCRG